MGGGRLTPISPVFGDEPITYLSLPKPASSPTGSLRGEPRYDSPMDDAEPEMRVLYALANVERIRILGLIAERGLTTADIANTLAMDTSAVTEHLTMLGQAGLIVATRDGHERRIQLRAERLAEIQGWCQERLVANSTARSDESIPTGIRQFFQHGRLMSLPAKRSRYLDVLRVLADDFAPDTDYPESEVNAILIRRHEDFATLRRDLVDFGFMTRAHGNYRRTN
jgi:DNA-binding MarR family transcriptional regulator